MNTFLYRILPGFEINQENQFEPCDFSSITADMWGQLAENFTREKTLFPCTAANLARRVQKGYAAAAIFENRVVSYYALIPIVHGGGCAPSWETLTTNLQLDPSMLPEANIYGSTSRWTAREWRDRGINLFLRHTIYNRYLTGPHLAVCGMVGMAQPILARLGWRIIGWDQVPFISSLVGIPTSEFPVRSEESWSPPAGMHRYQGPHIGKDMADHQWEKYIYLWASDEKIARELDKRIQILFGGNLPRWRSVIAECYTAPGSLWQVAFLNC